MRGTIKTTGERSPKGLQVKLKKWQSNKKDSITDIGNEIVSSPEFKKQGVKKIQKVDLNTMGS